MTTWMSFSENSKEYKYNVDNCIVMIPTIQEIKPTHIILFSNQDSKWEKKGLQQRTHHLFEILYSQKIFIHKI